MRLSSSTRPKCVIDAMRSQFARHGVPEVVMSDNGPQFSCGEFREFAQRWDFEQYKSAHHLNPLAPGDAVRMKLPGEDTWTLGECTKKLSNRSYVVLGQGHTYRRNRCHLVLSLKAGPMSRTMPRSETRMPMSELPPSEERMPIQDTPQPRVDSTPMRRGTRTRKPPAFLADYQ